MTQIAGFIYSILMGIVILFQFSLAIGIPWGDASMGGKFPGKYPPKMRIVAIINMLILSCMVVIVLVHANLALSQLKAVANKGIWFVVAFSMIAVILNAITPSKIERKIWAPISLIQLITCIIVAFN
jgi:hypothetical protein